MATGLHPDHSWIHIPPVHAEHGTCHAGGITAVPGLYFLGLPWQRTRGSSLPGSVQHDAAWLADTVLTHHNGHPAPVGDETVPGGPLGGENPPRSSSVPG